MASPNAINPASPGSSTGSEISPTTRTPGELTQGELPATVSTPTMAARRKRGRALRLAADGKLKGAPCMSLC